MHRIGFPISNTTVLAGAWGPGRIKFETFLAVKKVRLNRLDISGNVNVSTTIQSKPIKIRHYFRISGNATVSTFLHYCKHIL
jgi:hypothetical protein